MICDADTNSKKEKNLIDILEGLLSEAENQKPLNQDNLKKAKHKISRVDRFSEKYGEIVYFLSDYDQSYTGQTQLTA